MYGLLQFLRRIIPKPLLGLYHRALSWLAAVWYGHPSQNMVIVGVTGTSGKTTTAYLISKALEAPGAPTGCLTTALFKIGDREWENRTKMTMLGRFQLQKMLREMSDAGCRTVVVETTSQGIEQHRHEHIAYDVVVLTNLWPEHVEAHGGFENYKRAKIKLFEYAAHLPRKTLDGHLVPRVEVLNGGNEHAPDFVVKGFERVVLFGEKQYTADHLQLSADGSVFEVDGTPVSLHIPGAVNVENALASIAVAKTLGVSLPDAAQRLASLLGLPGRYERINEGQPFIVIVDFAFEPGAMKKLYESVLSLPHKRIIHVLGSAGGGRDVTRRPVLGRIAGEHADVVIITNEDPYDDDPRKIMEDVAAGVGRTEDLHLIDDRRAAIQKAIALAQPGDIVLITGKGSEPVMAIAGGKKVPWDDREEARKAIREHLSA